MSKDTDEKSPYGAGFIAACIVVGAVLICGIVIIFAGGGRSTHAVAAAQQPVDAASVQPTEEPASAPATPDGGPARTNSSGGERRTGSCGLPAGDQAVPAEAPAVDGWEVSRRVVVPRSSKYGPGTTDSDGFRHCFAHSPTGAVYAAYSAIAAIADQSKLVPTVKKLMVPGSATDSLLRQAATEDPASSTSTVQVVGYRVIDAGPDRVTLMLAMPVESVYMSANLTLVWHQGDWRLQPPTPGEAVGAPFSQHRDLSDFVKWSGI
ncbi:hypothetical protein EV649_5683 [Kribbella sp. VKM Ac-2569]|uniref:hypothetical protein n=1 Tax=Kribbella sp. VKM Ac-2569 TaxID=2512220 RepID=UPI00102B176B|nr:hypothetical protein [Kribbella sp. VKM Ac-2569]RZT14903.1 hypothetical protein EV649_5683 [Kribbella sp. VKM Ac-2569]